MFYILYHSLSIKLDLYVLDMVNNIKLYHITQRSSSDINGPTAKGFTDHDIN